MNEKLIYSTYLFSNLIKIMNYNVKKDVTMNVLQIINAITVKYKN